MACHGVDEVIDLVFKLLAAPGLDRHGVDPGVLSGRLGHGGRRLARMGKRAGGQQPE
jgi:hypothetical protein